MNGKNGDSVFYQTPFLNILDIVKSGAPQVFTSYLKNGSLSSNITFTAAHYNQDYDELIVTTDEHTSGVPGNPIFDDHLYRYILKGSGIVHAWYPFANLHPIYVFDRNPYPNDSTYVGTDNNYTTIIPTNAFTVLSSGAYNIRNCYVNAQNNLQISYPSCQLTYFTSHGPTLDGRIKPDILTPGENVISSRSANVNFFGYGDEIDSSYHFFSGTSASSPIAAGIAALIWERFPHFTRDSIINRIKSTARSDSFALSTGPLPNNIAGWGKADAFRALTGISSDLSQLCGQKLVCIPKPPTPPPPTYVEFVNISPNPANTFVNIQHNIPRHLQLSVFNSVGQLLKIEKLPPSNVATSKRLYIGFLPSGIYFIRISGGMQAFTKRILIQH